MEDIDNVTSEQVLAWARRLMAQKAQLVIQENLNEIK